MKPTQSFQRRLQAGFGLAVVAAGLYGLSAFWVGGADMPAPAKPAKSTKKKLSGSELYSIHCSRCHTERYPTEFNEAHWKTLLMHMRVRANLPATQAKTILKYLQEEAGS